MLATLAKEPVEGKAWIFEEKYDGIRAIHDAISALIAPWLRDRPLTAERCPDGLADPFRVGCPSRRQHPHLYFDRRLSRPAGMWLARMSDMARTSDRQRHAVHEIDERTQSRGVGHWFSRFSQKAAGLAGSPWAFILAVSCILVWLVTGPIFGFSDTWQLVANTVTTLVTTLMVFLIQNTQNRDARAIHLKLDELIRATPRARNEFMEAEEEDLDEIEREKAIVDEDDPAPPAHKKAERPRDQPGNGKTIAAPGDGKAQHP